MRGSERERERQWEKERETVGERKLGLGIRQGHTA